MSAIASKSQSGAKWGEIWTLGIKLLSIPYGCYAITFTKWSSHLNKHILHVEIKEKKNKVHISKTEMPSRESKEVTSVCSLLSRNPI